MDYVKVYFIRSKRANEILPDRMYTDKKEAVNAMEKLLKNDYYQTIDDHDKTWKSWLYVNEAVWTKDQKFVKNVIIEPKMGLIKENLTD